MLVRTALTSAAVSIVLAIAGVAGAAAAPVRFTTPLNGFPLDTSVCPGFVSPQTQIPDERFRYSLSLTGTMHVWGDVPELPEQGRGRLHVLVHARATDPNTGLTYRIFGLLRATTAFGIPSINAAGQLLAVRSDGALMFGPAFLVVGDSPSGLWFLEGARCVLPAD
jgi:hypothetical protein